MTEQLFWKDYLVQAHHRIAIGLNEVHLFNDTIDTLDWSKCVGMRTGSTHRLEIATSVVFLFHDKGLEGFWHFDVEPHSANGSGHYRIDVDKIQRVLSLLPDFPKALFREYLATAAVAVEKSAKQYQEIASSEYATAGALRSAAGPL